MTKAKDEKVSRKGEVIKAHDFMIFRLPLRIVTKEQKYAKRKP